MPTEDIYMLRPCAGWFAYCDGKCEKCKQAHYRIGGAKNERNDRTGKH